LIRKHRIAYSLGLNSQVENTFDVNTPNYEAFNIGRLARINRERFSYGTR
jgi:hypothetical protein